MRLTINKTTLANAVATVGKIIESRSTMAILSSVRLTASDGILEVTATDLDIIATTRVEADVPVAGSVCVEAKLIGDIAKKAAGDIVMSLDGDKLIVKSGRSRFSLATLPASDFPTFGDDKYDAEFELDVAALFAPVAFAISNEATRFYLNGVFFHHVDKSVVAVATDGHRLARHTAEGVGEFPSVIVPAKTVANVPKGVVRTKVSAVKIRFETDDLVITSKVIDGTFPDYVRVIPTANDKVVVVDRDEAMRAAERVVTVSSERGRAVKLSIVPGAIGMAARSDVGSAEDEVSAEYSGEPLDIGLNSQYLRDMFLALPAGPVTLKLRDSGSPVLVSGADPNWDGVIMPVRV